MAQQKPFGSKGSFWVRSLGGGYYPATFLTYADGMPVVDSVLANGISGWEPQKLFLYADRRGAVVVPNPNHYMVVPSADFMNQMHARGRIYGAMLPNDFENAKGFLTTTFAPKLGYGDPQYQGFREGAVDWGLHAINKIRGAKDTPPHWIPAVTNAGNYGVGVFFQAGGQSKEDALRLFGDANRHENPDSASYPFGNTPWGYTAINQGFAAIPTQASWQPRSASSAAPASTPFALPPPAAPTRSLSLGPGMMQPFPDSLRDPAMSSGHSSGDRFAPTPQGRDLPIAGITGINGPPAQTAPPAWPSALDDLPLPFPLLGGGTTPAPLSYPASPFDMTSYDWRTGRWANPPAPGNGWPGDPGQLPIPKQGRP